MFIRVCSMVVVGGLTLFVCIMSVLPVFALLYFELRFPVRTQLHKPILEPNKILPVAPIRRQHILLIIQGLRRCLCNLSVGLVIFNVPINLIVEIYFIKPGPFDITKLFVTIFDTFKIFR